MEHDLVFWLNGAEVRARVPSSRLLLDLLRDEFGLVGAREGCGQGLCGTCTVLLDGKPVSSCLTFALHVANRHVMTIEGLTAAAPPIATDGETAVLHPVQRAFLECQAFQCAYCTPGFILSTIALLEENPSPSDEEIREYLLGNICRCGTYYDIIRAVHRAAELLRQERSA